MSTVSLNGTTVRSRRLRWTQVKQGLAEWRYCARSRNDLMGFSDRDLQDIGLSRCTARRVTCPRA
jgi:uncharacterized protein YjiS (DUF1127 family)